MSVIPKVFRAVDHNGKVLSLVLAHNIHLARAYWQGQGIVPHSDDEVGMPDDHPTGVMPLYTAPKEKPVSQFRNRLERLGR